MPTIVDTLAIELSLDPRQLEKGLSSVVEKVRTTRDDYERHAKAFQAVAAGLLRVITPLAAAIVGITSAIEAIDWSKHAAAATTEFSNLANVIGMNISVLSAWKQTAEAAGKGGGDALVQSFARQQQTMLTMLPGGVGLSDPSFLQALQRYFGPGVDIRRWLGADGNFDMDRFNKDLATASERVDKTAAERSQWMQKLYITHPAQLSLYKSREELEEQLKYQRDVVGVLDQKNADAMKKLHADWTNLGNAAENLRVEIVTKLIDPLHAGLVYLQQILTELKDWIADPANKTWMNPQWWMQGGSVNRPPPSWYPNWMLTPEERQQRSTPSAPPATVAPPISTPPPGPSSVPAPPSTTVPPASSPTPVPATPAAPSTFATPAAPSTFATPAAPSSTSVPSVPLSIPAPSAPIAPTTPAPSSTFNDRFAFPGNTSAPSSPPTSPSESFEDYSKRMDEQFQRKMDERRGLSPHSSIDPSLLGLPHTAARFNQSAFSGRARSSINSSSNVTIGAMSFHATTQDAALGHAPAGSERTLATGQYSVEANSSLV